MHRMAAIAFAFLAVAGSAFAADDIPTLTGRVTDNAHLFTAEQAATLATQLKGIEVKTKSGDQVAILTIPSLDGQDIAQLSVAVGRKAGVGRKGWDNGVLILIAHKERQVFIAPGPRLSAALTDADCSDIVHSVIAKPLRGHTEKWFEGISAGVSAISDKLLSDVGQPIPPRTDVDDPHIGMYAFILALAIIAVFIIVGMIIKLLRGRRNSGEDTDSLISAEIERETRHPDDDLEGDATAAALTAAAAMGSYHRPKHVARVADVERHEEERHDEEDSSSNLGGLTSSDDDDSSSSSSSSDNDVSFGGGTFERRWWWRHRLTYHEYSSRNISHVPARSFIHSPSPLSLTIVEYLHILPTALHIDCV